MTIVFISTFDLIMKFLNKLILKRNHLYPTFKHSLISHIPISPILNVKAYTHLKFWIYLLDWLSRISSRFLMLSGSLPPICRFEFWTTWLQDNERSNYTVVSLYVVKFCRLGFWFVYWFKNGFRKAFRVRFLNGLYHIM